MFSQLRSLTASISQDSHSEVNEVNGHARFNSTDSQQGARSSTSLSSTQLAESALSSLRKSFATQRTGSPAPSQNNHPATPPERESRPAKSRLEDRLRAAAFAIGDLSNATTPNKSRESSVGGAVPAELHPLSPKSIALPDSPVVSPTKEIEAHLSSIDAAVISSEPSKQTSGASILETSIARETPPVDQGRYPEADIPLPLALDDDILLAPEDTSSSENHAITLDTQEYTNDIRETVSSPTQEDSPETISPPEPPEEPVTSLQTDTDALQERLKLVEQRFADVSKSFKRLQAEKVAADMILRELTPIDGVQDAEGLRSFLQNNTQKIELYQGEMKALSEKTKRQDERLEELRDTHRLESRSALEQIDKLRAQLEETEALLKASQESSQLADNASSAQKEEMESLRRQLEQQKALTKDEEEKRVKAVSLLKTVRQKTVKVEKEREDVMRELNLLKEKEKQEREQDKAERARLQKEIDEAHADKDNALRGFKAQFDRELSTAKQRQEKELASVKSQFELEAVTTQSTQSQEITAKNAKITALENSVNSLSREKNSLFEQLQLRQAELESSQFHTESLQSQNTELQYQLRECQDRISQLNEEASLSREVDLQRPGSSVEDVARLLSATEVKHEVKLSELRRKVSELERERNESELDWSKKLRDKTREAEELRRVLESSTKGRKQSDVTVFDLNNEIERMKEEAEKRFLEMAELRIQIARAKEEQDTALLDLEESNSAKAELQGRLEEYTSREVHLKANNKTLREELRKVQSSAALLERQRNPGVGYWTHKDGDSSNAVTARTSISSDTRSPTVDSSQSDEEVNLEYLRNVILQFLEHKEMRPNLVRVLSIILRFTPQETRRLMAKV